MVETFRLFGIKIWEKETLTPKEQEQKQLLSQHNPKGEVLNVVPEPEEDGNYKQKI